MATILIIEDNSDIADTIQACLKSKGHTCRIAESGEIGLELYQQDHPDLITLDLGLPGMNGLEVCRKIRQNQPHPLSILILAAPRQDQDFALGLEAGADDYLKKQFSPKELIKRVATLLKHESQAA